MQSPIVRVRLVGADVLPDLLHKAAWSDDVDERERSRQLLSQLAETSPESEHQLHDLIETRLRLLIENMSQVQSSLGLSCYMGVLLGVCSQESTRHDLWATRVQMLLRVFHVAVDRGHDSALVAQHIVIPCLNFLNKLLMRVDRTVPPAESRHTPADTSSPLPIRKWYPPTRRTTAASDGANASAASDATTIRSYMMSLLQSSFDPELCKRTIDRHLHRMLLFFAHLPGC